MHIEPPFYPIVYVRGFAPLPSSREGTFHDAYYGFADTSVEKKAAAPQGNDGTPRYTANVFEGQLIRFLKEHGYVDSWNNGLMLGIVNPQQEGDNPVTPNATRSIWISRFYDADYFESRPRDIKDHAEDLRQLVCETIPDQLQIERDDPEFKVILLAHSMGGLVSRCLIQNVLPKLKQDPKRWIHRFVTMGTPHGGIDFGAIPDFLETLVADKINPLGGSIFQERSMRDYLNLGAKAPLKSLGDSGFPTGRCLCIIGSNYQDYDRVTQKATGNRSDGLVKQENAFIEGAFTANVHRAHSGYHGIVNSNESYQNIRRFLFGDTKVEIWLLGATVNTEFQENVEAFYDFEFRLSVRDSGVYLHEQRQNPCENSQRFKREDIPAGLKLHTAFLNSRLRRRNADYLHFAMSLRVSEHQIHQGLLWDHEYPERPIFSETLELRIGLGTEANPWPPVEYRWVSDTTAIHGEGGWQPSAQQGGGDYLFDLRGAGAFSGQLCLKPSLWPDIGLTQD